MFCLKKPSGEYVEMHWNYLSNNKLLYVWLTWLIVSRGVCRGGWWGVRTPLQL